MKKFITIWISCSLALAAGAIAQQPDEQKSPAKKKQSDKARPREEAKPEAKGQSADKEQAQTKAPRQGKAASMPQERTATKAKGKQPATTEANATGSPDADATATSEGKKQAKQGKKQRDGAKQPASADKAGPSPASATAQSPAASQAKKRNAQAKKPDPQAVQAIKEKHANFRAQPKPQQVPSVTFNENYRIQGADRWQGPQYEVFRSYRPEIHDQSWYRSRYDRIDLIGGGYYYWNNGYWYPAWGYDPSAQYYAYDAPIYVGSRAEPPDRVIADVQAILQQQGYYRGEVDGLLGPLTREALTAYQSDNGLYATAVIDEPTLSSLGMG